MTTVKRILIVEDETIVALLIEDLVAELGHAVAGVVARLGEALARADDHTFDLAILDVHLQGENVFPFADRLLANGTPFLFATGFGTRGIPERFRGVPALQKPFTPEDLAGALARLAPPPKPPGSEGRLLQG